MDARVKTDWTDRAQSVGAGLRVTLALEGLG